MNKEIFKLEELLKNDELAIPYTFNYREENRPTPFGGESKVDWSKEDLIIIIGPTTNRVWGNAIVVAAGEKENKETPERLCMNIDDPGTDEYEYTSYLNMTAENAYEIIKENFLKHRAEWWPEIYGK